MNDYGVIMAREQITEQDQREGGRRGRDPYTCKSVSSKKSIEKINR